MSQKPHPRQMYARETWHRVPLADQVRLLQREQHELRKEQAGKAILQSTFMAAPAEPEGSWP